MIKGPVARALESDVVKVTAAYSDRQTCCSGDRDPHSADRIDSCRPGPCRLGAAAGRPAGPAAAGSGASGPCSGQTGCSDWSWSSPSLVVPAICEPLSPVIVPKEPDGSKGFFVSFPTLAQ